MRNLKKICVAPQHDIEALPITAATWDASSASIISVYGPSPTNAQIKVKGVIPRKSKTREIASWDSPCPLPELSHDQVLSIHHLAHLQTSCLVLCGGDVIHVKDKPLLGEDRISIVGSVDAGLTGASWSPDGELLALMTRENTLLIMTTDLNSTSSTRLKPEDMAMSRHVSVGWGKSETQFKGKGVAKAMRDPTMPEVVETGSLSQYDEGQVTISWRGDGGYVAVNSIEGKLRRIIRIFTREGVLESVSEPVDGLEGSLSWRPAGNLIAGIQRKENDANVVFFERNGLRHGSFSLRLSSEDFRSWAKTIDLHWNSDSSVLAIAFSDRVQLWMMGNYHYYLKQEISIPESACTNGSMRVLWHPEDALRLIIYSAASNIDVQIGSEDDSEQAPTRSLYDLQYALMIDSGPTVMPNDLGLVTVIDGHYLKITPLRKANIPPPMAFQEIKMGSNAIDVAANSTNSCLTVLHERFVSIYKANLLELAPLEDVQSIQKYFSTDVIPLQICFRNDKDIFVLLISKTEAFTRIYHVDSATYFDIPQLAPSRLFHNVENNEIYLEHGSEVSMINISKHGFISSEISDVLLSIHTLPNHCSWINLVSNLGEDIVFGLNVTGTLYANSRDLVQNCTSFVVTDSHLILTTTNHLLKFINIDTVSNLDIPLDEPESDERCRCIERGARIVTVIPSSYALVLQMPRGNLETIYPRALVLAGIRKFIHDKEYKKAFMVCRSHKVDFNILHDYAPVQFIQCIPIIIEQLDKVEYLDLLLTQLRDEDVSQTLYRDTFAPVQGISSTTRQQEGDKVIDIAPMIEKSKVNRICDAFLGVLEHATSKYMQTSITAHVCKSPPDLDAGLSVIIGLRKRNNELTDTALEHICFIADVNQLYSHAMGLYDLEVALLVAQQSQKDPREYLPYLQRLQDMTETQRQFTIDDDLGKHDKALVSLHLLKDRVVFDKYMVKHGLYQCALDLYKYDQDQQRRILLLYAEYLNSVSRFRDAGIAFDSIDDFKSASEAYKSANLWKECLASATLAALGPKELISLATSLAEDLIESKDYQSAAYIKLEYLTDVEAATKLFCRGYYFTEALQAIGHNRRSDLLATVFDTGLIEGSGSMTELLADCKSQLQAQIPRLRELRLKKLDDPLAFYDGTDDLNIPDNVSLAPTNNSTAGGTFFTRYTNRTGTIDTNATRKTSKNRRREERKRARGKKGSVYEEEYLVNSIERLIVRVNSVNDEVRRLVEGLLRRRMRARALAVEMAMEEVVKICQSSLEEVFEISHDTMSTVPVEENGGRPPGADGVYWDSVREGKQQRTTPVVQCFERSPLLGR